MRPLSLESLVPGLKEARAQERLVRAMAFARVPWTLCGSLANQLTPRIRLEFQLTQNAFAVGLQPQAGDVFQILWRLHPRFNRLLRNPLVWLAHRRVSKLVKRLKPQQAVAEISVYLNSMMQDLPEGGEGSESSNPPDSYVHWMAIEQNFYCGNYGGFTPELYKDTPYVELQQLFRAHRLSTEEHPHFINYSDTLVGRWQREQIQRKIPREQP